MHQKSSLNNAINELSNLFYFSITCTELRIKLYDTVLGFGFLAGNAILLRRNLMWFHLSMELMGS